MRFDRQAAGHPPRCTLYITKLRKAEHDAPEWQAAMEALLLVAEHDGPTMFARIGVMRASNRRVERVFDTAELPFRVSQGSLSKPRVPGNRRFEIVGIHLGQKAASVEGPPGGGLRSHVGDDKPL